MGSRNKLPFSLSVSPSLYVLQISSFHSLISLPTPIFPLPVSHSTSPFHSNYQSATPLSQSHLNFSLSSSIIIKFSKSQAFLFTTFFPFSLLFSFLHRSRILPLHRIFKIPESRFLSILSLLLSWRWGGN